MKHPLYATSMSTHKHQMFYDETNNFRKLIFNKQVENFNTDRIEYKNTIFYLGGIALPNGYDKELELKIAYEDFKSKVNKDKPELKFDDIARNDFISVLKSAHLNKFLNLLVQYKVCVHFFVAEMIYLVITDLVEPQEIINKYNKLFPRASIRDKIIGIPAFTLKDILNNLFRANYCEFLNFINRTNFPKILNSEIFIEEFIELLKKLENQENTETIKNLLSIFENIEDKKSVFKDGFEPPSSEIDLINSFSHCYFNRVSTLDNCSHIFDEEKEIQDDVLNDVDLSKTSVKFIDSLTDYRIHMSDIFIGFTRKFIDYHLEENLDAVKNNFNRMNKFQKECIANFLKLQMYSHGVCPFFFMTVISFSDRKKVDEAVNFYIYQLNIN